MTNQLHVLIVGASVAGPTAAYWFAKAGAKVTVIERFPALRTNGQNVDIRTAGVTVMRKIPGMEEAVRAKAMPLEGISFVNSKGRAYGIIKPTGNPDQQSLVSEYEIYRGDLAQILYNLTKDNENVSYVFGEQIVSMQQAENNDGPVKVEFANGFPTSTYDLVVACDGATSRTRAMGLGCGNQDYIRPINSWAAYFSVKENLYGSSRIGQAYSAKGGRFVALGADPSGMNRATLMGVNRLDDDAVMVPFRAAAREGDEALKSYITRQFKGAGWKTDDILGGLTGSPDFYATEVFQVKLPALYKGRFVLVGDAGYAPGPTGAGTTLALAGAYVLAGEVSRSGGDLAAALRGYEEQMRPLITDMQVIPTLVPTVLAPQTASGLWLRNMMFSVIARTRIMEFTQKYFAAAFSSRDKYNLPNYTWVA
ncbi:hypothetical protein BX600DRAFT_389906 [Xylariales sp. PMI_506]|nr:hypothetical protein BX600DRAFT_389906 [Xylariales sp. PMI_506]